MVNARTATAADFDERAQRYANLFWGSLVVTAAMWWVGAGFWWIALLGANTAFTAWASISCTRGAGQLRAGTYRIPNPNNGAPDGDAANYASPKDLT